MTKSIESLAEKEIMRNIAVIMILRRGIDLLCRDQHKICTAKRVIKERTWIAAQWRLWKIVTLMWSGCLLTTQKSQNNHILEQIGFRASSIRILYLGKMYSVGTTWKMTISTLQTTEAILSIWNTATTTTLTFQVSIHPRKEAVLVKAMSWWTDHKYRTLHLLKLKR